MTDWIVPPREQLLTYTHDQANPQRYAPHNKRTAISFVDGHASSATLQKLVNKNDWWNRDL